MAKTKASAKQAEFDESQTPRRRRTAAKAKAKTKGRAKAKALVTPKAKSQSRRTKKTESVDLRLDFRFVCCQMSLVTVHSTRTYCYRSVQGISLIRDWHGSMFNQKFKNRIQKTSEFLRTKYPEHQQFQPWIVAYLRPGDRDQQWH